MPVLAAPETGCIEGTPPEIPADTVLTDCVAPAACDEETVTFTRAPVPALTSCDDDVACTLTDECDGDGPCIGTPTDTECDDSEWYIGFETCAPESDDAAPNGCLAGTPPELDDGIACTVDACEEEADSVTQGRSYRLHRQRHTVSVLQLRNVLLYRTGSGLLGRCRNPIQPRATMWRATSSRDNSGLSIHHCPVSVTMPMSAWAYIGDTAGSNPSR
ncbi:MAG: hypothetical protein ACI9WU_001278 [Myxococcota bacterium]